MQASRGEVVFHRHLLDMLVHQNQETEGVGSATVKVNSRTVSNTNFNDECSSGIVFGSDGVLSRIQFNGGTSAITGEWLVSGLSSNFYVERTIDSGTLQTDPGAGFLQLNATRSYENQTSQVGVKTTVVTFQVASDAGGTNIVATATMTFESNIETF